MALPKIDLEPDVEEGGAIADAVRAGSLGFGFSAGGDLQSIFSLATIAWSCLNMQNSIAVRSN